MNQRKIIVQDRQSIWDVTLREFGSVEGVFLFLADNPNANLGFASQPIPGTKVKVISEPVDKNVVDFYYARKIEPVSLSRSAVTGGDYNIDFNDDYTNDVITVLGGGGGTL